MLLVVVGVVSYGAFIRQTVANVVDRKNAEAAAADLAADVSELESVYMTKLKDVTLARALEQGFVEQTPTLFVSRDRDGLSVRYDNE